MTPDPARRDNAGSRADPRRENGANTRPDSVPGGSPLATRLIALQRDLRRKAFRHGRGRGRGKKRKRPRLVHAWASRDRLHGGMGPALTFILGTRGCAWASGSTGGCFMCGYIHDAPPTPPKPEALLAAFKKQWTRQRGTLGPNDACVAKIYTSGSFLDERELARDLQAEILATVARDPRVVELVVESRPEFVTPEATEFLAGTLERLERPPDAAPVGIEIGIGVETSDDAVRRLCINKGFSWSAIARAVEVAHERALGVKAYLLFKPPFLSEARAIADLVESMRAVAALPVETISINPVSVHRGSVVEWLYRRGYYRPPWFFSLLAALRQGVAAISADNLALPRVLCTPTAPGKARGMHSCLDARAVDQRLIERLEAFVASQDPVRLAIEAEFHDDPCYARWRDALALAPYLHQELL